MSAPIAPEALSRLRQLQQKPKFSPERYYPGAPNEDIRSRCEKRVNDFLSGVISSLQRDSQREDVFTQARALNSTFAKEDTEEREKVEDYIGETMRIIGLEDWTEHV